VFNRHALWVSFRSLTAMRAVAKKFNFLCNCPPSLYSHSALKTQCRANAPVRLVRRARSHELLIPSGGRTFYLRRCERSSDLKKRHPCLLTFLFPKVSLGNLDVSDHDPTSTVHISSLRHKFPSLKYEIRVRDSSRPSWVLAITTWFFTKFLPQGTTMNRRSTKT
jgi:hypothetical protein